MSIHAGALVGRYRVVREVGEGDFATVCRAYDAERRRLVTIKILHAGQSQDARVAQRFQQEAAAAMRLAGHPHVLGVYATGQVEGRLFVVAEFLAGATLDRCLSAPLDLALAARVVTAVAAALDAAHGVGLVHRDLSPAHVVLGRDGRIAVADFGVAGLVSLAKRPTQAIRVLGTPEYLAPELATGASPSPASDQYALAVVAFEVLAGQRPFQGDDPLAVLYAHTHEQPLAPTTLRPDLPPAVDDVVLRALAKDPQQRFPTCTAFASALGEALGLPSGPQRPEPAPSDRTLDALVERTRGLVRSGDFATALRALQVALAVLPEDQRLRDLQAELDEEQRFAERYERALLHVRAHEWHPAREILNALHAERPDYRDVTDLRAQAFAAIRQAWEKEERLRPEPDPFALGDPGLGVAAQAPGEGRGGRDERAGRVRETAPAPPTRAERRAAERLADELGWRYDAALAAMEDGHWRTAVTILEGIYERTPSFRDVASLLKRARRALAQEQRGAEDPPPARAYRPARFLRSVLVGLLETSRKLRLPKRHRQTEEADDLVAAAEAEARAAVELPGPGAPTAAPPQRTAGAAAAPPASAPRASPAPPPAGDAPAGLASDSAPAQAPASAPGEAPPAGEAPAADAAASPSETEMPARTRGRARPATAAASAGHAEAVTAVPASAPEAAAAPATAGIPAQSPAATTSTAAPEPPVRAPDAGSAAAPPDGAALPPTEGSRDENTAPATEPAASARATPADGGPPEPARRVSTATREIDGQVDESVDESMVGSEPPAPGGVGATSPRRVAPGRRGPRPSPADVRSALAPTAPPTAPTCDSAQQGGAAPAGDGAGHGGRPTGDAQVRQPPAQQDTRPA